MGYYVVQYEDIRESSINTYKNQKKIVQKIFFFKTNFSFNGLGSLLG